MGCSVVDVFSARSVERRGPSSFLAISYFICKSLLIGLASVRAQECASSSGPPSEFWDLRTRNSALLEALLRARFLARKREISLIVWLASRGKRVPDRFGRYLRRTFVFWARFRGASAHAPTCADRGISAVARVVTVSPFAAGAGS